jgi:hypothetical protein
VGLRSGTGSGTAWAQQGLKLVGNNAVGQAQQGFSVALSADGSTAIVGGPTDNNNYGAAWVFTKSGTGSGTVWVEQGPKLVGNDAVSGIAVNGFNYGTVQGASVALSGDGNTAIMGGSGDNAGAGATWVFTRSGTHWTQQGSKLVGTGAVPPPPSSPPPPESPPSGLWQGFSVALSDDGNTVIVGGHGDNNSTTSGLSVPIGATWVFTRKGVNWTQQGSKRIGNGGAGVTGQGYYLALSGDGNTALVGGPGTGVWVFARHNPAATHDFNGDGKSDIAWHVNANGATTAWLMNGGQILQLAPTWTVPPTYSIVGQRDFDGDGNSDILWRDTSGNVVIWFMNGTQVLRSVWIGSVPTNWTVIGTGDFNGDGKADILWQDTTNGNVVVWYMNGTQVLSNASLGTRPPTTWTNQGADVFGDIFWRDTSGYLKIWQVTGGQVTGQNTITNLSSDVQVVGLGDFNGDGVVDLLIRDTNGYVAIGFLNSSGQLFQWTLVGTAPGLNPTTSIALTGDYDGDGQSDILWIDSNDNVTVWFMNGASISSMANKLPNVGTAWQVQSTNAE